MITAILPGHPRHLEWHRRLFATHPLVRRTVTALPSPSTGCGGYTADLPPLCHSKALPRLAELETPYLLLVKDGGALCLSPRSLERMIAAAEASGAALLYGDYHEQTARGRRPHPLTTYEAGCLRESFDFGPLMLLSRAACREALRLPPPPGTFRRAGLYDLRLRLSCVAPILHLPESLCAFGPDGEGDGSQTAFSYQEPQARETQKEMEQALTAHLQRIGAYLPPVQKETPAEGVFPVEASIVIPVKNRLRTVGDALRSALAQQTSFPFNVICVDNRSTDGTTSVLREFARTDRRVHLIRITRPGWEIGGCWNEAVYSRHCGRYAIQLDSDDLYDGPDTLQRLVDLFRQASYAMVIGAYRLVNERLEDIPPGVIAHREWTAENGPNNALRINGLGAPRAFATAVLRRFGFPNVSYGEDYAVALRICREYPIGRIYDPLYLCRRWAGNTDAAPPLIVRNRFDRYKDRLRTLELLARQALLRNGTR